MPEPLSPVPLAHDSPMSSQENPRISIEGTVQSAVFVAKDQSFAVLRLEVPGSAQPLIAVGALAHVKIGETVQLHGQWETHTQYGKRFRALQALPKLPATLLGIERYLTTLNGFGPESSRRIVAHFGMAALTTLENEPWRVAQIKGIGKRRVIQAATDAKARREEREIMIFLQGHGISATYATRIRKTYGANAIAKVTENPYRLAKEVPGIGFQIADQMAAQMGVAPSSPLRLEAGLLHCLERASDAGHCYLPKKELFSKTMDLFRPKVESDEAMATETTPTVSQIEFSEAALLKELPARLASLEQQKEVICDGDDIFSFLFYHAEIELTHRLKALQNATRPFIPSVAHLDSLSASQQQALQKILSAPVSIVTGGPGTGKTTLVRTLVRLWKERGKTVILLAPTGRASRRLSETTAHDASTIHRALEWNPSERTPHRKLQLQADLVVCDEASMLDLPLAQGLIQAIAEGTTLVFVGDVDQLPSVGPGRVLFDLIESGQIPIARLVEVFRQAEGSMIIQNAHRILHGELPVSARMEQKLGDFYFIEIEDPQKAQDLIVRLCLERIPTRFGLNPIEQIQVLTPMHRGEIGTEALNQRLQKMLNPKTVDEENGISRGGTRFCLGDKVMQIRNDYDRDVWNGDVGLVESIQLDEQRLWVQFDDRRVLYQAEQLDQLELAYAISVHKSQGSEYKAVIIPLFLQHFPLLKRNLLYTAVTRGKQLVVILGSQRALRRAIEELGSTTRYTKLATRFGAKLNP